jgi:hypothetical protein
MIMLVMLVLVLVMLTLIMAVVMDNGVMVTKVSLVVVIRVMEVME